MEKTHDTGFTLLEAVIALAIAAIALTIMLESTGTGMSGMTRANLRERALSMAQSRMAGIIGTPSPASGIQEGDESGFHWKTDIRPIAQSAAPKQPAGALLSIDITISRNDAPLAHLRSQRAGPYDGGG